MLVTQIVRCPDCGSMAQRHFQVGLHSPNPSVPSSDVSRVTARTECHDCDYFLEICMTTGQVLASHIAPVFHDQQISRLAPVETSMFQVQPT